MSTYSDRPFGEKTPALVAWSPYGKRGGFQTLDQFPGRLGVPVSALSDLQVWEGPDPAYWCNHGYIVVNADARGAFMSQGDIYFGGSQEGEDGHDLVEWLAEQEWCNGKIGFTGNSWLAMVQWLIAAQKPPHLAAIAPWEGLCDLYRGLVAGGIPDTAFSEHILAHLYGNNRTEDVPAMAKKYPLMNAYWEDKAARLDRVEVPAYIVASYTNPLHPEGTLSAYEGIPSAPKWLRIHNSVEWPDYYEPENVEDLRRFFDHYLKGIENGWEQTPKVRLSILDPGGKDEVNRSEGEFPSERTEYKKLFLDARSAHLMDRPVQEESSVRYRGDDGKGKAAFSIAFDRETVVVGRMSLRLWVEAQGCNDMDLFVWAQKLGKSGRVLNHLVIKRPALLKAVLPALKALGLVKVGFLFYLGPQGRIRASRRQLDLQVSTVSPRQASTAEEPLQPGQIVPLDIVLWPTGMRWHPGEQLRVTVAGHELRGSLVPNIPPPSTVNSGHHVIHTGGRYDSHLLVPVVP